MECQKDLAYAHDYIRSTVRNNGDTEEFPNLVKICCLSFKENYL